MGGWLKHYSLRCQPVDYSDNPVATRVSDGNTMSPCAAIQKQNQLT